MLANPCVPGCIHGPGFALPFLKYGIADKVPARFQGRKDFRQALTVCNVRLPSGQLSRTSGTYGYPCPKWST